MSTTPPVMLRPLNIGEIFDRAVTLYVQNFVLISLMLLTASVPLGIAVYPIQSNQVTQFTQAFQAIQQPHSPAARQLAANPFPYTPEELVGLAVVLLLALILSPVATNAVALGIAALYRGRQIDFKDCYGKAIRSWLRLIGTALAIGCVILGTYAVGVGGLAIVVIVGVAAVKGALPVAIVLFVLAGLAFLALLVVLSLMVISAYFAMFAVSIESSGVFAAVGSGLRRTFGGGEFKRAILMALAFGAVQMGVGSISGIAAVMLLFVLKAPALYIVVETLTNAILTGFGTTLMAIYYYDVRVRRESYDLEADLERLGAAVSA